MSTTNGTQQADQARLLSNAKASMSAMVGEDLATPNFHAADFNVLPAVEDVKKYYVGKSLQDVPAPAVILHQDVIRKNCNTQLHAAKSLGLGFRAHVKTHKTLEITRMQVGENSKDIRLVVSTVAELELLLPWLVERKQAGASVNIIYGIPFGPSVLPRLAEAARKLGEGSISLIIDHSDHIRILDEVSTSLWPGKIPVFPKIDVGYQRAGIVSGSTQMHRMVTALAASKRVGLHGFYAHQGDSYASSQPSDALKYFTNELNTLRAGADEFLHQLGSQTSVALKTADLTLTIGASPTATAIQNLTGSHGQKTETNVENAQSARDALAKATAAYEVEVHAGVYCVLDMQQVATQARPDASDDTPEAGSLRPSDLALRLMVEVISVYDDRGKPEVLIGAGSIALGREPCKSYAGWGVVAGWSGLQQGHGFTSPSSFYFPPLDDSAGWKVDRISQEHGVLGWHGSTDTFHPLAIGERVLLWPNHACMCGPNFPFYLVVDEKHQVVDVWLRCRGW